jgi:hypothetical protein
MCIKTRELVLVLTLGMSATPLSSQTHEHAHEHDHEHKTAQPGLSLDQGKKWTTDAPLREGMTNIRKITAEASTKPTKEADQKAAGRIHDEIQKIFKNCKLSPKADANLHLILAELMAGASALKDPKVKSSEAHARIKKALDQYGQYFDHPGWTS